MDTFYSRAEWLAYVRKTYTALTQRQMATLFDLRHPTVCHWEVGRNEVPDYVVQSIARSIPAAPEAPSAKRRTQQNEGTVITFDPGTTSTGIRGRIDDYPKSAVPKTLLRRWLSEVGL